MAIYGIYLEKQHLGLAIKRVELFRSSLPGWFEIWDRIKGGGSYEKEYLNTDQIEILSVELLSLRKYLRKGGADYEGITYKLEKERKRIKAAASKERREIAEREKWMETNKPIIEKYKPIMVSLPHPHPAFKDSKTLWDYAEYTGKYGYALRKIEEEIGNRKYLC